MRPFPLSSAHLERVGVRVDWGKRLRAFPEPVSKPPVPYWVVKVDERAAPPPPLPPLILRREGHRDGVAVPAPCVGESQPLGNGSEQRIEHVRLLLGQPEEAKILVQRPAANDGLRVPRITFQATQLPTTRDHVQGRPTRRRPGVSRWHLVPTRREDAAEKPGGLVQRVSPIPRIGQQEQRQGSHIPLSLLTDLLRGEGVLRTIHGLPRFSSAVSITASLPQQMTNQW